MQAQGLAAGIVYFSGTKALGGAPDKPNSYLPSGAPFFQTTSMQKIFIGKLIEEELRAQERSVVWLARKLDCNRTNIYKIFHRPSIDTDLLFRISTVLNRNFFECYTDRLAK